VRDFTDGAGIARVPVQWSDDELDRVHEFVDGLLQDAATPVSRGVEQPATPETGGEGAGPETATERPYDPENPPSEVLEAAIDRAKAIEDRDLTTELLRAGYEGNASSVQPDTKRRRLVTAWLAAGWLPDAGTTAR
jgi:hypothetical protein